MITKSLLRSLYTNKKCSVSSIAKQLNCSEGKVNYWLKKHGIPKRSISESVYLMHNPTGDPFQIRKKLTNEEAFLDGVGIGLYWGEGTKRNKYSVRLGNTDPRLISVFMRYLESIYSVDRKDMKFGLQVFSDVSAKRAKAFWVKELGVKPGQFHKVIITPSRGAGTYRRKSQYGVLTVHYNNKKLRDIICGQIDKL